MLPIARTAERSGHQGVHECPIDSGGGAVPPFEPVLLDRPRGSGDCLGAGDHRVDRPVVVPGPFDGLLVHQSPLPRTRPGPQGPCRLNRHSPGRGWNALGRDARQHPHRRRPDDVVADAGTSPARPVNRWSLEWTNRRHHPGERRTRRPGITPTERGRSAGEGAAACRERHNLLALGEHRLQPGAWPQPHLCPQEVAEVGVVPQRL